MGTHGSHRVSHKVLFMKSSWYSTLKVCFNLNLGIPTGILDLHAAHIETLYTQDVRGVIEHGLKRET